MTDKRKNKYDTDQTVELLIALRDKGLSKEKKLDLRARCEKIIEHIDWSLSLEENI
ncbi:Uncharacterised protein [Priestia megaterium]|uniref:hypothetical protein n=1 Tax=Priestia megaterium TaxID=1404 RepID=UPI000E1662BC|nr:hypothetical protein [Priestia megaterium]SUV06413.1 Uncharacterised protein [Priestia megaterium]